MNLRAYYFNSFLIKFNFDFGVLAQKCLRTWVNGVLKFQFFFLNLSSKVLAGVGVRTSKYPYMDICALFLSKTHTKSRKFNVWPNFTCDKGSLECNIGQDDG